MDELNLFRDFRRGVAAPSVDARRRASARLVSVIEEAVGREQGARLRHRGRRRRLVAFAAAAAVVVVAASAFATVLVVDVKPWARGKLTRTVDGVRFSLNVPKPGWENGPHERIGDKFRTHSLLISKSMVGGQAAEAVMFWTGFRDRTEAAPCAKLLDAAVGGSTADVAAAVVRAPGTKLVTGPTRVTVGGRPALHVVLRVRRDLGCDPGYFFTWPHSECWGACWLRMDASDTIRVWIVSVGGTRLFIEAATKERHAMTKEPVATAELRKVQQEITKIIGSIRFD